MNLKVFDYYEGSIELLNRLVLNVNDRFIQNCLNGRFI